LSNSKYLTLTQTKLQDIVVELLQNETDGSNIVRIKEVESNGIGSVVIKEEKDVLKMIQLFRLNLS